MNVSLWIVWEALAKLAKTLSVFVPVLGLSSAELIEPNQSLIIDAGTTAFHVSRYLDPKTPHIITNSLSVANHFASNNRIEVMVSGGVI